MTSQIPNQSPDEGIVAVAQSVTNNLQNIYDTDIKQVNKWFYATWGAGVLAFFVLLLAVYLMLNGQTPVGIGSAVFHLLTDGFVIFFGRQLAEANKQKNTNRDNLSSLQIYILAFQTAQTIEDKRVQRHYKGLLIIKLLGLAGEKDLAYLQLLAREADDPQVQPLADT
jgi:hypothetical protein